MLIVHVLHNYHPLISDTKRAARLSLHTKTNPKSFTKAIMRLLTDKKLYKTLSINAKECAVQRTWTRILPMHEKLYGELLQ